MSRMCSECSNLLEHPASKTCSKPCRQKRQRRLEREKKEKGKTISAALVPAPELTAAVNGDAKDAAHEVLKEELRPHIRERITGNVLSRLDELVNLTPAALARLEADLDSEDDQIRQRAYTLVLRYTLGNPSAAPPPADQTPSPVSVVFQLPRPGDDPARYDVAARAEELVTCTDCLAAKPADEFVSGSDRCAKCYDEIQAEVARRFQ